jgi:hypothetical protein
VQSSGGALPPFGMMARNKAAIKISKNSNLIAPPSQQDRR